MAVHGNNFWQTDDDVETQSWSRTYNLPCDAREELRVGFGPTKHEDSGY